MKNYDVVMHGPHTGMVMVTKQIAANNLADAKRKAEKMGGSVNVEPYSEFSPLDARLVREAIDRLGAKGLVPYTVPDEILYDGETNRRYVHIRCEEVQVEHGIVKAYID